MIYIDPTTFSATDGVLRERIERDSAARTLADARNRLLGDNNRFAVRPKTAEEAGIRMQDARVTVTPFWTETCRTAEPDSMQVAVYSLMKPGAFKRVILDRRDPSAAVQIAAGACCEALCEEFGDPFDPAQAADAALDAYRRLRDG